MAITPKTQDFLFQNRMQDSREWFLVHKKEYEKYVKQPLRELAEELAPIMESIDPQIVTNPARVVSRINRDTRFTKDKSLYRDVMWLSFQRDKKQYPLYPGFFFEFGPDGIQYGCGFFHAQPRTMDVLRDLVLKGVPAFQAAQQSLDAQQVFSIGGERYKRSRYPAQPDELRRWLECKNIYFVKHSTDSGLLFSEALHVTLAKDLVLLKDSYSFLLQVCEAAQA